MRGDARIALNDPTKPTALAQSTSLSIPGYITVPRVIALIDANGSADTTTALANVYNGNNPRSVVTGNGTSNKTSSQDTRDVEIYNGQLYVSVDSKEGSGSNRDFIGTLGAAGALPTGLANNANGPTRLPGYGNSGGTGKLVLTAAQTNGVNAAGQEINLSPESFFFANPTTLYVADSGSPKNDSALNDPNGVRLGNGGLQKWIFSNGSWSLAYTLAGGLNLVQNSATAGVTGLLGLTGRVNGTTADLYATSYTIGDTDQTFLYGITDILAATVRPVGASFTTLAAAPADSTFKGVAFAPTAAPVSPVPEPATWALMIAGFGMVGATLRRRATRPPKADRLSLNHVLLRRQEPRRRSHRKRQKAPAFAGAQTASAKNDHAPGTAAQGGGLAPTRPRLPHAPHRA